MDDRDDEDRIVPLAPTGDETRTHAYAVELWDASGGQIERVIARAAHPAIAKAAFDAAQAEYPDRRLVLRRGAQVLAANR